MRRFKLLSCTAAVGLMSSGQYALAQEQQGLDEIIVTAERTEQNLQKVSQSVTSISGDRLELLGIKSTADLAAFVPGVTMKPGNAPSIFIRGVGTSLTSVTGDPGVAMHIDGVFQTRPTALNIGFFDLERVEILKGPQGTLYGRGSVGGSINLITASPKMELAGAASAEYGNFNAIRATGMVNIPIDDTTKTAVRLAFMTDSHDAYASNGSDDNQGTALRARIRTNPVDQLTVDFIGALYRSKGKGVGFYPIRTYSASQPNNPDKYLTSIDNPTDYSNLEVREGAINVEADLGFGVLTFLPSFVSIVDKRRTTSIITSGGVPGTSNPVTSDLRANTEMQELRLASPKNSSIKWVVGLYHLHENNNYTVANGRISGVVKTNSSSAFAQVSVPIVDGLNIIGGIRYTEEKKDQITTANQIFNASWSPWNYRASAEYQVTPRSMLYATYATGFKAGGFFVDAPPNSYEPETNKVFEVGSKNRFFNNSLQLNLAAFYAKYQKYQVQVTIVPRIPGGTSAGVFNGGDAEIKGGEIELVYQLSPQDRFEVSGNYTDGKFTTITLPNYSYIIGTAGIRPGDRLPTTAVISGNVAYTHDFLLPTGKISARAETHLEGASYPTLDRTAWGRQRAYSKSNFTLTYAPDEAVYTVSAWVRNIEDVAVRGGYGNTPNNENYTLGPPRTYGVTVSAKF